MANDLSGIPQAMVDSMREYANVTTKDIKKAVRQISKDMQTEIVYNSPVSRHLPNRHYRHESGFYKQGWKVSVSEKDNTITGMVHNANNKGIVHVLEYGRKGVSPDHHVKPANDKAADHLSTEIDRILREANDG